MKRFGLLRLVEWKRFRLKSQNEALPPPATKKAGRRTRRVEPKRFVSRGQKVGEKEAAGADAGGW